MRPDEKKTLQMIDRFGPVGMGIVIKIKNIEEDLPAFGAYRKTWLLDYPKSDQIVHTAADSCPVSFTSLSLTPRGAPLHETFAARCRKASSS